MAALPTAARAGRIRLRADAGYFAGQLARAALFADIEFAIGARRIAPLWRLLDGIAEADWTDATRHARRPGRGGRLLPQLVARRDPAADPPGPPRRRPRAGVGGSAGAAAPHPAPRPARPAPARTHRARRHRPVYGYSFIVTNLDVSTGEQAAAVEHWYRHRTSIENVFRDAKHGAALRHLPSGYPEVNRAWMWGALLAVSLTGWLHQLTATPTPDGGLVGHGVREGQAMIATLRHRLIRVPARLVRHAGALILRLPPGYELLDEVLARIRALPATS